jgi:DNA modification methylase
MSDSHPTMTTNDTETPVLPAMPETAERGGCSSPSNCSTAFYEDSQVKLWNGDCREILPTIRGVDCVVTDPPYFLPASHYSLRGVTSKSIGDLSILERYFKELLAEIYACLKPTGVAYVFCDGQSYPIFHRVGYNQWKSIRPLIWDKGVSVNGYGWRHQHELIAYMTKPEDPVVPTGDGDVLRENAVKVADRLHPAEKPSKLIMRLIQKSTKEGQTVLDPFAGSGSTLLAARDCGRKAIGIEIEPNYCQVAIRRIHGELMQSNYQALRSAPTADVERRKDSKT